MDYLITIPIEGDTADAVSLRSLKLNGVDVTQSPALPQAMTDAGGGSWTRTVSGVSAGSSYQYVYRVTFGANSFDLEGSFTVSADVSDAVWKYSDLASLQDYLGELNTEILSNQGGEDDTATNVARVVRDGKEVDSLINMALRGGTYIVPITKGGVAIDELSEDHETRMLFRMFSNRLTAYMLNQHRLLVAPYNGRSDFDKNLNDVRNEVVGILAQIKEGGYQIDADLDEDDTDEPNPPGVFTSVPIVRGGGCW